MGIPNSKPMPFTPRGLADAYDASAKFPGACQQLANLVFDQGNPELVIARPGVQQAYNLAALGISSPQFVSVHTVVGSRIYGMVASSRNSGRDEPFCVDTATGLLVPIAGITSANSPVSPSTTGDWTPPTIASVGPVLLFTHPGFSGVAGAYFGALSSFTTWNSNDKGAGVTLSAGNLVFSITPTYMVRATTGVSSGKYYWEVFITSGTPVVGISTAAATLSNFLGQDAFGWSYAGDGNKYHSGSGSAYGATYTVGDLIGIALDLTGGTLTFYKNGVSQGTAFTGLSGTFYPAVSPGSGGSVGGVTNFGANAFAYAVPIGFTTLDTLLTWSAQNTTGNGLPRPPTAVANFNNRAYYAVGNSLYYSDNLAPLTITNASQGLTVGDTSSIVALAGQPIETTSSGVVSSLLVWKNSQIWQVTGDTALNNLSLNFLSLNIGTNSPRSIVQVPMGVYFLSQVGGPYIADPLGNVHALTYDLSTNDPDLQVPFQNATTPTRWAGGYIASIYRVCGPTVLRGRPQVTDYWFDEHRRRWNGPHSFAYDCASGLGSSFLLSSSNNPGLLFTSSPSPQSTSAYTDPGGAYSCLLQSATFPKTGDMSVKQVVESQIELGGLPAGATYTITAQRWDATALGASVAVTVAGSGLALWGGAGLTWGQTGLVWNTSQAIAPATYPVPWKAPLVFEKMAIQVSVAAGANVQIGTFFARYQRTGYMVTGSGV